MQAPTFTQSFNRYCYCLNNPLTLTDPTGNKWDWNWLNPLHWFSEGMQWVNDNTEGVRQKMADAGIPDFGVGTSIGMSGSVSFNASYQGQVAFNTENIDRSNAVAVVDQALNRMREEYWEEFSGGYGYGYRRANMGADNALTQFAYSLSYVYHVGGLPTANFLWDFSNSDRYFKLESDMANGTRHSGQIGPAQIEIYSGSNVTVNGLRFFAKGGFTPNKSYLPFSEKYLDKKYYPTSTKFGNIEKPYAIQITGYFGERKSVVGTIWMSDYESFKNFYYNIYNYPPSSYWKY